MCVPPVQSYICRMVVSERVAGESEINNEPISNTIE